MINGKHRTTKRQRRATFSAACQIHLQHQFGLSKRKRYARHMKRMPKETAAVPQEKVEA